MQPDLTLQDVLTDPLIAQLLRADGISTPDFTRLLFAASETYTTGKTAKLRAAHRSDHALPMPRDEKFEAGLSRDVSPDRCTPKASETCLGW
jgi:hypothetical protein